MLETYIAEVLMMEAAVHGKKCMLQKETFLKMKKKNLAKTALGTHCSLLYFADVLEKKTLLKEKGEM